MAVAQDFRRHPYSRDRIEKSGRYLGNRIFWKLFEIENSFRIIAHSILQSQIGTNWWDIAVDPRIRSEVDRAQKRYATRPWLSTQGVHNIYFLVLNDLTEIFRANSHLFLVVIPEINDWIAKLESVRPPRNVVAHMNFPLYRSRKKIESLHAETRALLKSLSTKGLIVLEVP